MSDKLKIVPIAALMAMAGCGGGGSGDEPVAPRESPLPTPERHSGQFPQGAQ